MRHGAQTHRLDVLFDRRANPWSVALEAEKSTAYAERADRPLEPPVDVVETAHAVVVIMDLPGYDPATLQVSLHGRWLRVCAERHATTSCPGKVHRNERGAGSCERAVALPAAVDADNMTQQWVAGVLSIALPKVF